MADYSLLCNVKLPDNGLYSISTRRLSSQTNAWKCRAKQVVWPIARGGFSTAPQVKQDERGLESCFKDQSWVDGCAKNNKGGECSGRAGRFTCSPSP
ncbi:hypothetical protein PoB_000823800 [Plakobranchus ocellatus]|uniref:SRCR domain-containing protein n=1 Tax=Plakobranchus ocellatus TaxID=259542 RepID=A0AAV3YH59_9GAST|nr:hypothetical protein PoB_000823800 [Plakobranchus ocellatus]